MLRPSGADDRDPRFREALQLAARDPELKVWLADQLGFDRSVAAGLQSIAPPADLRQLLLDRKVATPEPVSIWPQWLTLPAPSWLSGREGSAFWPRQRAVQAGLAVAALLLVLGIVTAVALAGQRTPFGELRQELLAGAFGRESHLEFRSADLGSVQNWLASQGVSPDVSLPAGLHGARLQGCQVVEADGHRIPMLCLSDGSKHLHLFVVPGDRIVDQPSSEAPDFQKYGAWKTASWSEGHKTYILSGLKTQTFVTRFRKSGRWTMSG